MRKMTYYADAHENPETVECRKKFIARCLAAEIRMHGWTQLSRVELNELEMIDPSLKLQGGLLCLNHILLSSILIHTKLYEI